MDRAGSKVRRYLSHAEELRMVATFVRNPAAAQQMIETAEAYERLAASVLRLGTRPHETANGTGLPQGRA
jgi:hypothetical protein